MVRNLNGSTRGDVTGPSSATDADIALFDGTSGKLLKDSAKTIVTTIGANDLTLPTSKAVVDKVTTGTVNLTIAIRAGEYLRKKQAVYISGTSSGIPLAWKCDCTVLGKSRAIGIVQSDMNPGDATIDGFARRGGTLTAVDCRTTGTVAGYVNPLQQTWANGDLLFALGGANAGGLTNVRPTSGRTVKVCYAANGNDPSCTLLCHIMENPIFSTCAANEDVVLRCGDSSGTNIVSIRNYTNKEVASINSYGVISATAPTAAVGTNTTQIATTAFVRNAIEDIGLETAIGVKWKSDDTTPALTQIDSAGSTIAFTATEWLRHRIFGRMRRCTLDSVTGAVKHYYGDPAVSLSNFYDGTDGQVMVEIPKFWYKTTVSGVYFNWWVSPVAKGGYKIHPMFFYGSGLTAAKESGTATSGDATTISNSAAPWTAAELVGMYVYIVAGTGIGQQLLILSNTTTAIKVDAWTLAPDNTSKYEISRLKDYVYISAFEGSFEAGSPYKLQSIANVAPGVSQTLTVFRTRAQARNADPTARAADGAGWQLLNENCRNGFNLLMIIRDATLNSQATYQGITDAGNTAAVKTGFTSSINVGTGYVDLGNASGEATGQGTAAKRSFSRFGVENWFGNVWKWVDGIHIAVRRQYIANHGYHDSTTGSEFTSHPYIDTTLVGNNGDGYQVSLLDPTATAFDTLMVPSAVGGSDSTYLCDYYYHTEDVDRALFFGGRWAAAGNAGAFNFYAASAASYVDSGVGGRLAFK